MIVVWFFWCVLIEFSEWFLVEKVASLIFIMDSMVVAVVVEKNLQQIKLVNFKKHEAASIKKIFWINIFFCHSFF